MDFQKKVLSKYFNKILSNEKKWEFRLNDFNIQKNDTLTLIEINDETKLPTGRKLTKKVSNVTIFNPFTFYSEQEIKEKGVQIIEFKDD